MDATNSSKRKKANNLEKAYIGSCKADHKNSCFGAEELKHMFFVVLWGK